MLQGLVLFALEWRPAGPALAGAVAAASGVAWFVPSGWAIAGSSGMAWFGSSGRAMAGAGAAATTPRRPRRLLRPRLGVKGSGEDGAKVFGRRLYMGGRERRRMTRRHGKTGVWAGRVEKSFPPKWSLTEVRL